MPKKNTLLYLDEELVDKAKKMDVNLSKLTENAIKSKIFPDMAAGQKALFDLEGYMESLEEQGRCFRIPHRIKKVELENIGPFDSFEDSFEPFTVIKGPNASGKTTLIRSIAYACCCTEGDASKLLKDGGDEGRIEIKTNDKGKTSLILEDGETRREGDRCILLDDPLTRLDESTTSKFIEKLRENFVNQGCQVILTDMFLEDGDFEGKLIKLSKKIS